MNIVAKSDFNFKGKALVPVANVTGVWLTSSDLAKALEYSNSRAVTMIYNKYSDEFTSGMTQVLEVSTSGNYRKKVRIFSLRGAHCYQRCKTDPPQRLKTDPGVNLLL